MNDFLIGVTAFVVVLGLLVLIHEFGHFAAAKLFGVRVETFSIGFGKRLLGFKRGDTDYRISALPLGGYVKMSGENPLEPTTGDPGEFMSHPRWQRFVIALAGPFMNIVFAVVLVTGVYMVHFEHPAYLEKPAVLGGVFPGSPAEQAGLKQGDRIIRIEDKNDPTWEDVSFAVMLNADQPLSVVAQRGSELVNVQLKPLAVGPNRLGEAGFDEQEPVLVGRIDDPKSPAAVAGLKEGDQFVSLNGAPVRSLTELLHLLQTTVGNPSALVVDRDGKQMQLTATPQLLAGPNGDKAYRLGFVPGQAVQVDKLPFPQALSSSIALNRKFSGMIFELLHKLVQRKVSIKQFDGPIGIGRAAGDAAQRKGWLPLILLTAAISLNLGIFNLLPIPIMDGGVILLLAIEAIMRRDINARLKERIYQAAFVFLILFAVVVIYNDLAKLPGLGKFLP